MEKYMAIASALRKNARKSLTELSKDTNIPVSTIFNRIKSKQSSWKYTALVDFNEFGFNTRTIIALEVDKTTRREAEKILTQDKNINSLSAINHGYDFLIDCVFKNIKEAHDFIESLDKRLNLIRKNEFYIIRDLKREDFLKDVGDAHN